MKPRSIIYVAAGFFLASLVMMQGSADARRWSFSTGQGKIVPRVIDHFITIGNQADSAQKIPSTTFRPGEKLHFYYKIGPLQCKSGSGAPFQTRLVIKKGGRTVKDFGWQNSNAANASQMNSDVRLAYYHSSRWNLSLQSNSNIATGSYTAIVEHKDMNSGKLLRMRYPFKIDTAGDGS